jgi:hypothetical protein
MLRLSPLVGLLAVLSVACGASSSDDDADTSLDAFGRRPDEKKAPQPMADRDGKPLGGLARTNCDIFLRKTRVFCENDTDNRATCKDVFTGTIDVRVNVPHTAVGVRYRSGAYDTAFPASGDEPGQWSPYVDLQARPVGGAPKGYQRYEFRSEPLVTASEGPLLGIGGKGYDSFHIDLFPYADTAEGRLYDAATLDTPGRQVSFDGRSHAYEAYVGTRFDARDHEAYCNR